ncbi:MAG: hypothetical protein MJ154_02010 [Candidatus Saccharibacteria bacterium]|nr:hypothetical protein [Candidatus Saccharibacteria bacterium]
MQKSKTEKTETTEKTKKTRKSFKQAFNESRDKVWAKKNERLKLHHSFKRSYREDYTRGLQAPGLVAHAMSTLKILRKNWKLFGGMILIIVFMNIVFVGLMSEATYQTVQDSIDESTEVLGYGEVGRLAKSGLLLISTVATGGLTKGMTEVQQVFAFLFGAITILVTIYYLRHLMAGNRPSIRDGLYNALTPLVSCMLVLLVVFLHMLPIFIFTILYSTAVATNFLAQPLYAFLFWLLGSLLILLSAYLLPGSILAVCATTVPGIYPMQAINATTDLVQGRRTKFIIRLFFSIVFMAVMWVIIMVPIIWLDLVLKQNFEFLQTVPIVPFILQIMTTFTIVYLTAYIYLFYRRMLDDPE